MPKVMMIGTSENSGGGISSVIRLMKKMPIWQKYSCYWLGTQTQQSVFLKLWDAIKSALLSPIIMWKYNIIHFHMVPGITLFIQLPELLIAKLYRKKIIMEVHVGNQLIKYSRDNFFKWWFKQADLILLLAHKWETIFKEYYSDITTETDVLYNACEIKDSIPFNEKQKIILFAGTINSNKAPDLLLKAWARIKDKYPDWKLIFLGNGDITKYKQLAASLNISNNVEFKGYIIGKEKENLFNKASIYCMCSYLEGFPMVVLEAWTHSIAVITTPVGGLPDAIEEGINCITFPFGDYKALAKQIDRLITDENLRKTLCENGYKYSKEHFSLNIISTKLDNIYKRILKK